MMSSEDHVSNLSTHFDYERRIFTGKQRIHKKRIMTGREYENLFNNQKDPNKKTLKILRTSFMYEKQYF